MQVVDRLRKASSRTLRWARRTPSVFWQAICLIGALAGLCCVADVCQGHAGYLSWASFISWCWPLRNKTARRASQDGRVREERGETGSRGAGRHEPTQSADDGDVVQHMLACERYALLLRPQIVGNLDEQQANRAREALLDSMALVPAGDVLLEPWFSEELAELESSPAPRRVTLESLYLDRYPVTNREFLEFVRSGCYRQSSLWQPTIWEQVATLVDQTGRPAPRGWRHGEYAAGHGDHPVVGVCWYEAEAYARWVGKRLPTDAEWVKAACWAVVLDGDALVQRKYPWGDHFDAQKANLWSSGRGTTVPVTEFAAGRSVGGIQQLIGNVWEWTSGNLQWETRGSRIRLEGPLKSLRGGAFDTYFDSQATSQFQSGDSPNARRCNVGFRCAISACDVSGGLDAAVRESSSPPVAGKLPPEART